MGKSTFISWVKKNREFQNSFFLLCVGPVTKKMSWGSFHKSAVACYDAFFAIHRPNVNGIQFSALTFFSVFFTVLTIYILLYFFPFLSLYWNYEHWLWARESEHLTTNWLLNFDKINGWVRQGLKSSMKVQIMILCDSTTSYYMGMVRIFFHVLHCACD